MKAVKWFNLLIVLVLMAALAPASTPAVAQTATPGGEVNRETLFVPGEVVVAFDAALKPAEFQARAAALAGEVSAEVVETFETTALLSFDPSADVPALAQQLAAAAGVRYAEPNFISWLPEVKRSGTGQKLEKVTRTSQEGKQAELTVAELLAMRTRKTVNGKVTLAPTYPNDIFSNWGNDWIYQTIVWPTTNASPMVCVVDTGVDVNHPELKGIASNGYDYVNNDAVANDDHGHGTHVSGTIAAKTNNGGNGMAGISNGKVLAVKVLSAQGWGTDLDIAMGIRFCANNTAVKVINMSLGGTPSRVEYEALQYAINTKGKLVVASAGNDSESWVYDGVDINGFPIYNNVFPAAWADPDNLAPHPTTLLPTEPNTIFNGLISVGAARSPWSQSWDDINNDLFGDGAIWVDVDGDGVVGDEEYQQFDNCATDFSNYGSWVEIVAPGEDIFSSTPVSYPFYESYFYGVPSSYDSWGGTSMAAPHVSGAAARLWSINPTWNAATLAAHLQETGNNLNLAIDPNVPAGGVDEGYSANWGAAGEAPFCWPNQDGAYTPAEDMTNSTYLNLAAAMNRFALSAEAVDASTGLPLVGAQIQAVSFASPTASAVVRATAQLFTNYTRWVDLINLSSGFPQYGLRVSKPGQTAGFQQYYWIPDPGPGGIWWFWNSTIGVPASMKDITVVANWYQGYDLDLYVWLPQDEDSDGPGPDLDNSGVVGPGYSGSDFDMGAGALYQFPRARWHRDGVGGDYLPVESVTIAKSPSGNFPYYWNGINQPVGWYEILLNAWQDDGTLGYSIITEASPIIRVWYQGKIQLIWDIPSNYDFATYAAEYPECLPGENWWWPITLYRQGTLFWVDAYNNPVYDCQENFIPYTEGVVKPSAAKAHKGR